MTVFTFTSLGITGGGIGAGVRGCVGCVIAGLGVVAGDTRVGSRFGCTAINCGDVTGFGIGIRTVPGSMGNSIGTRFPTGVLGRELGFELVAF